MASVSRLLDHLASSGVAAAAALRAGLGISPPTLSRLVAEAGEDVHRMGRGRASRYARTRTLGGLGRRLPAFRIDEKGEVHDAGTLHLLWGRRTFWQRRSAGELFDGLPPALADMAPQGYLGAGFAARFPELRLPPRLADWSDDHRLTALALRGHDCPGDLVIGDESLRRFLAQPSSDATPDDYPHLAVRSAAAAASTLAGGERPKFGALALGRHVLVKFAPAATSGAARRWRDLLWCEWKALQIVAAAGRPAARAQCLDLGGWRFLEVERFDRSGPRGRRPVLSLGALSAAYLSTPATWTAAAPLLTHAPFSLSQEDAARLRWLDVFGQLIGHTERHPDNVAFFAGAGALRLAPAYDVLPAILAPAGEVLVRRAFEPAPPTGSTLDVWADAAGWAQRFWREVSAHADLESEVRAFADQACATIAVLADRVAPKRGRGPA
jgi:hypothetical protein